MDYYSGCSTRASRGSRVRHQRLREARKKGQHTPEQWQAMKARYQERCVRCLTDQYNVERDHIVPLCMGGSDGIENIQPLCARCNASKSLETTDWRASFDARMGKL